MMTGACYCLAARKAARKLVRLYDSALAPHGLTVAQFSSLAWIKAMKRPTVQRMADRMELDQSALSRGLVPLEREGLVTSEPDPEDGRRKVLRLTPKGEARLSDAAVAWKQAQRQVEETQDDGGIDDLVDALSRLGAV
ncbi:hypothetical protein ATO6_07405 [Oceanicola sp. 22II-s10i]|nr:hypothetical protein ATO6_07405 [Oceanicola sp. 22II-s10i]